jgi:hypothetical protein
MNAIPLPMERPMQTGMVVAAALPVRPANMADVPWPPVPHEVLDRPAPPAKVAASAPMTPNEVIRVRGYWKGPQEAARVASAEVQEPATTGSIPNIFTLASAEAKPAPGALAYAAVPVQELPVAPARRSKIVRSPETATSVAVKVANNVVPAAAKLERFDPWLSAVAMTPSVRDEMSATQYGARDFLGLRKFLDKPDAAVTMAFASEPYPGLSAEYFGGQAVVFLGTMIFAAPANAPNQQTASLQ